MLEIKIFFISKQKKLSQFNIHWNFSHIITYSNAGNMVRILF